MHVLMISSDVTFLTGTTENARARHEGYARTANAKISVVICNRRKEGRPPLGTYDSDLLRVRATESAGVQNYLQAGERIGREMAENSPFGPVDLITSQDPFLTALVGLSLRRRLNVPIIIQNHSSFLSSRYFALERPRNRWLQIIAKFTLPRADAVRVVNKRERLACLRLGIRPEKVCIAPVPVETSAFAAPQPESVLAAWRQKLDLPSGTPVVMWAGRPVTFKNLPMLIRAFRRAHLVMPEVRLLIVGDVSETTLRGQVAGYGLTDAVRFAGPVAYDELPAVYQLGSVYALSSNYEGLARVLLEAMAAGLPVVSTDNSAAADAIVNGVTGILTPIGDEEAFANALISVLRDPAKGRELAANARAYIQKHFDPAVLAVRWPSMWARVAAGKTPCES